MNLTTGWCITVLFLSMNTGIPHLSRVLFSTLPRLSISLQITVISPYLKPLSRTRSIMWAATLSASANTFVASTRVHSCKGRPSGPGISSVVHPMPLDSAICFRLFITILGSSKRPSPSPAVSILASRTEVSPVYSQVITTLS